MTVLTMPTEPGFREVEFMLASNSEAFTSPLSGSVQTVELPGARWGARYTLPRMDRDVAVEWQVFLAQLRGQGRRFYGYDEAAKTPRGIATGTPLVDGASQTGTTLDIKGWTTGQTGILKKGDYFAFDTSAGRELKMMTADVDSNGSGLATLEFEPPIRTSPADDAAIITASASCQMMLIDNTVRWRTTAPARYSLSFDAIEAFGTYT